MAAKQIKGAPTELNLWVLKKLMNGKCRCTNQIASVDYPHMSRCLKAGLIVPEDGELVLTSAGVIALVGA